MEDTSIMVNLGDPKAKEIAEVIGNKTANKILDYLVNGDKTVSEIAGDLKIPLNTVDYNVKKLLKADLIEKKNSWWSVKGKKMPTYCVSNKKIIISPKRAVVKSLLIVIGLIGLAALFVGQMFGGSYYSDDFSNVSFDGDFEGAYSGSEQLATLTSEKALEDSATSIVETGSYASTHLIEPWVWFLIGAFVTLVIVYIVNLINRRRLRI